MQGVQILEKLSERVSDVLRRNKADALGDGFTRDLRFGLMEVVYEWARGMVRSLVDRL